MDDGDAVGPVRERTRSMGGAMLRERSRPSLSPSRTQAVARSQSAKLTLAIVALLVATVLPASAQTATAARGGVPRMWDGKPDLNGVWQALTTANFDLQDHAASLGVPA